jgi:hypothetical protein
LPLIGSRDAPFDKIDLLTVAEATAMQAEPIHLAASDQTLSPIGSNPAGDRRS